MPHVRPWNFRSLLAHVSVGLTVSGCGGSTSNPIDSGARDLSAEVTAGSGGIDGSGGAGGKATGGAGGAAAGTGGSTRSGGTNGTGSGGTGGGVMGGAGGAKSGGAGGAKSGGAGGARSGGAGGAGSGGAGAGGRAGAGGSGGKGGGTVCGTIAGLGCPPNTFCEFPVATCNLPDNAGLCRSRPEICPANIAPVCGCDGKSYSNDCVRQGMGVSRAADGSCATGAGGTGGGPMPTTSYAGCHFIGGIDRLVIAKYDDQSNQCVALVLADNSGIPAFTGLTISAPWYAESASRWPSTTGDCVRRDVPSGALRATTGSGTVTITGSTSSSPAITVDATITFRGGGSGTPQTAELKKSGVTTAPSCP